MKLTLVTPEKKIALGIEVDEITVPAYAGELNILPGHAPLMTLLEAGTLKYRGKDQTESKYVAVSWGYCQVSTEGVNVLAEFAETPEEVKIEENEKSIKDAESKMLNESLSDEELKQTMAIIAEAKANLGVVQYRK